MSAFVPKNLPLPSNRNNNDEANLRVSNYLGDKALLGSLNLRLITNKYSY